VRAIETALAGVFVIEPTVFHDERGYFFESFNRRRFRDLVGFDADFVQDNHSRSRRGVLRGLHYQIEQAQGKLVRVVAGEVFDVAVDIRRRSPSFGKWVGMTLSGENQRMLWIPPGFAHGYLVMSESCDYLYKTADYWAPAHERCIRWDDALLGIDWPLVGPPILSERDKIGLTLHDADVYS
jgi:dTDP-4-dehydrorhamnose 3,5-epimerase